MITSNATGPKFVSLVQAIFRVSDVKLLVWELCCGGWGEEGVPQRLFKLNVSRWSTASASQSGSLLVFPGSQKCHHHPAVPVRNLGVMILIRPKVKISPRKCSH